MTLSVQTVMTVCVYGLNIDRIMTTKHITTHHSTKDLSLI